MYTDTFSPQAPWKAPLPSGPVWRCQCVRPPGSCPPATAIPPRAPCPTARRRPRTGWGSASRPAATSSPRASAPFYLIGRPPSGRAGEEGGRKALRGARRPPAFSTRSTRRPSERRSAHRAVNYCFSGRREGMPAAQPRRGLPRRPFVPSSRSGGRQLKEAAGPSAFRVPLPNPPPPPSTHKQHRPPPSPPPPSALPSPSHLLPPALSPAPLRLHKAPGSRERAASPPPPATAAAPSAAPPPRAGAHTPQPAPAAPSLAPIGFSAPGGRS